MLHTQIRPILQTSGVTFMSVHYLFKQVCRVGYSACLILAHAFWLAPNASNASEIYGRGVSDFKAFAPEAAYITNYKIQGDLECPTPNIRVGGFAGNANDWANVDGPIPWSSSGLGSHGIAASLSIPLGGQLGEYCKKYAMERLEYQKSIVKNMKLNSQYSLYMYCRALTDAGLGRGSLDGIPIKGEILFAETAFSKNGPLSAFKECEPLYALLLNRSPNRSGPLTKDDVKTSDPKSPLPAPTADTMAPQVQIQRNIN